MKCGTLLRLKDAAAIICTTTKYDYRSGPLCVKCCPIETEACGEVSEERYAKLYAERRA